MTGPVTGLLRRQVRPRAFVAILALAGVLGATVAAGGVRQRAAIEEATARLRVAVAEAASLTNCFEGVQDDLFLWDGLRTTGSEASALDRLEGCDVGRLERRVARVLLPAPAPLAPAGEREVRAAIEEARVALDRVTLDARGTKRAMRADLAGGDGSLVVVGYEAVRSGYERAVMLLGIAEAGS